MAQADKRKGSTVLAEVQTHTIEEMTGRAVVLGRDTRDPRQVFIGKLSIDQWLGIAFLAVKVAQTLTGDQKTALEAVQKADSDWAAMIPMFLNKANLLGLIAVLSKVDEKWLDQHFSMAEVMELLDAIDEAEDLRRIMAPFQRIAKRWRSSPASGSKP